MKQARSEAEADWADRVTDSKEWVKKVPTYLSLGSRHSSCRPHRMEAVTVRQDRRAMRTQGKEMGKTRIQLHRDNSKAFCFF